MVGQASAFAGVIDENCFARWYAGKPFLPTGLIDTAIADRVRASHAEILGDKVILSIKGFTVACQEEYKDIPRTHLFRDRMECHIQVLIRDFLIQKRCDIDA